MEACRRTDDSRSKKWWRGLDCSIFTPQSLRELAEVEILRQLEGYEVIDAEVQLLDPKEMPQAPRRIE
jgi:hypothetical protein